MLGSLVDKSLLRQEEGPEGEPRFVMLETIREYALEQLAASGEAEKLHRRHAEYYLALVEAAAPYLLGHPQQAVWLDRFEYEHDNLRAALSWSAEAGAGEHGLRLVGSLAWFWYYRGHLSEGQRWLERLSLADSRLAASVRAKALLGVGWLALRQSDYGAARVLLEEGLTLLRETGDTISSAHALNGLGCAMAQQGEYAQAIPLLEQALALYREAGDLAGASFALNNLGETARWQGDTGAARAWFEQTLSLARQLELATIISTSLTNLGFVTLAQGDTEQAATLFKESLGLLCDAAVVSTWPAFAVG